MKGVTFYCEIVIPGRGQVVSEHSAQVERGPILGATSRSAGAAKGGRGCVAAEKHGAT